MKFSVFSQSKLGSSFVSPALGWAGQGRLKNIMPVRRKKFRAKPKQAGWGWESVSATPASAGRQNRKIFVSVIEKILARGRLKNVKKIFLFCSLSGERKRWAGLSLYGRQLKINVWISVKKS